jgi:inosine-uridine nucleoside N-ribohydrolase
MTCSSRQTGEVAPTPLMGGAYIGCGTLACTLARFNTFFDPLQSSRVTKAGFNKQSCC